MCIYRRIWIEDCLRRPDKMPKVKPGQSRKGKNKAPKTTTQRDQSSSTGLSAEAEQALIDKISNSVVDKLKKGGPTTEHEGGLQWFAKWKESNSANLFGNSVYLGSCIQFSI